ncbi:MAG TPA: hypothetical protein VEA80_14880 [Vitreimonas sp.]|uniref:hypothetical protein n=1 Tax=Vitreimonas sp. TaxID=3069702 RepID=UPI002D2DC1DE|nr:hypothetical protein [Vitreimonas sp.]HYD88757.1 hypothetical protein [Vitreimonas sp.]
MRTFWPFARLALAWSLSLTALATPFAFLKPLRAPPPCDDWLWCSSPYVGVTLAVPLTLGYFAFLLTIPSAFIAFSAARIALRSASPRAHWFMLGPALAILAAWTLFLVTPIHYFSIDLDASYGPALLVSTAQVAFYFGSIANLAMALTTLIGAVAWRVFARWYANAR